MSLKHLSKELTSYDLLKTVAVLLMLVDHTGYYFFPDDDWWRVFGRLCVPIWFFLIGYARSRDLGPKLWIGMLVLVFASGITGMGFFPVNILGTMIVIRLVIDKVMVRSMQVPEALWQVSTIFILLTMPSSYFFEYGSLAIVMAMYGWLVRNHLDYAQGTIQMQRFFFLALGSFTFLQAFFFAFDQNQIVVMCAGTLVVMVGLMFFKPHSFSGTGEGAKAILFAPFRFMGRWTLEIYVAHLLVFKALVVVLQPDRFTFLDWRLIPESMVLSAISGAG
ncbi:MAG: TraX family protein [Micavibrio sp.]